MGKGSRQRKQRAEEQAAAKEYMGTEVSQKALNKEINEELVKANDRFYKDEVSVILWVLHQLTGWGAIRLKRYFDTYTPAWEELKRHYQVSDDDVPWITKKLLKDIGVDLDEWMKD